MDPRESTLQMISLNLPEAKHQALKPEGNEAEW